MGMKLMLRHTYIGISHGKRKPVINPAFVRYKAGINKARKITGIFNPSISPAPPSEEETVSSAKNRGIHRTNIYALSYSIYLPIYPNYFFLYIAALAFDTCRQTQPLMRVNKTINLRRRIPFPTPINILANCQILIYRRDKSFGCSIPLKSSGS